MPDTRISLMTPVVTPATTDQVPVVQGGVNKVETITQILSLIAAASTTVAGRVELATLAEVTDGTDTARAVTPQGLKQQTDLLAPRASPVFTTAVTLPVGLTGIIRADSGVVSVDADVTPEVAAGTTSAAGKIELATLAEVTDGTDTARAVTPQGLKQQTDLLAPRASPVFTTAVTLPVGLTGIIRADSGVVSVDADVTPEVAAASTTTAGKIEIATLAEVTDGTDTARAVTPQGVQQEINAIPEVSAALSGGITVGAPAAGLVPLSVDSTVLRQTGTQTISGSKQFSGLVVADTTSAVVASASRLDIVGGGATASVLQLRSSAGTYASPTATAGTQGLGQVDFQGYEGTTPDWGVIAGRIQVAAGNTFTSTNQSTTMRFMVVPSSSTTLTESFRLAGAAIRMLTGFPLVVGSPTMTTALRSGIGMDIYNNYATGQVTGTYAATSTIDTTYHTTKITTINATGPSTFIASATGVAGQPLRIIIVNDATSAKTITFTTNFRTAGTLTPSAASRIAVIDFESDGTTFIETSRVNNIV